MIYFVLKGCLAVLIIIAVLVFYLRQQNLKTFKRRRERVMAVMGSGGHTAEMLYAMRNFNFTAMKQVVFTLADTDKTTLGKSEDFFKNNNVKLCEMQIDSKAI
jgi:transketolase N-terminal domain/subunit